MDVGPKRDLVGRLNCASSGSMTFYSQLISPLYILIWSYIGIRDGGSAGRYDIYSGKKQHICLNNCVTERNKYAST